MHRAALYTIQVHKRYKPKEPRLLGNIDDDEGVWLGDVLDRYFTRTFQETNDDEDRSVTNRTSAIVKHEVQATFTHGTSGQVGSIVGKSGDELHKLENEHSTLIKCAGLFVLPRNRRLGWWVSHSNNGRSAKGLLTTYLRNQFGNEFEDLVLRIQPAVPHDALVKAINEGTVDSVHLSKLQPPTDSADALAHNWVRSTERAKIDVRIEGVDGYLRNGRLKQAVRKGITEAQRRDAINAILEFQGQPFDKATVTATMGNGGQRTFNIERPEAGHAFTVDMPNIPTDDTGDASDDGLFKKMRTAIADLG